jgi:hypothetical protein
VKRLTFAASLLLAVVLPGAASAHFRHERQYTRLYHQVAHKLGKRAPGRNIVLWGMADRPARDADVDTSIGVLERMLVPPSAADNGSIVTSAGTSGSTSSGGYSSVPGVPASFAACVALRESSNGAGSSNIYGILGSGGQGSVAQQKQAMANLYHQYGTSPWAPYDGC